MKTKIENGQAVHPSLQKRVNYSEFGVLTKQQFIEKAKRNGWQVQAKDLNGYQNGEYNRAHFNRLQGEDQTKYESKLQKVKTVYSIQAPGESSFYDITRTEFEYFNAL